MKKFLILFPLLFIIFMSCRREEVISGSGVKLKFSTDTVFLDTVFTTVGSSTYSLKVYNTTDQAVNVDNIRLGRGQGSEYRLNVDGTPTKNIRDVEILPHDSIYIFIEITASATGQGNPLYTDSIIFTNKGTDQNVKLVTLTRNAYFHYPHHFVNVGGTLIPYTIIAKNDTTWPNDKPHVIYGYGVIDEGGILHIQPGTEVYFHNNSGLWVYKDGSLKINEGTTPGIEDSVTFQGDRLEPYYEDVAGQWGGPLGGIYIMNKSVNNVINNCVIKNATTALRLDSSSVKNLDVTNTYILNSSRIGIYGGFGNITATNVVVGNAGLYLFYAFGGNYEFRHCTFADYWNPGVSQARTTAAVTLANYLDYQDNNGTNRIVRPVQKAYFGNCIIDGSNLQELDILKDGSKDLNYSFNNVMLKVEEGITPTERGYDLSDQSKFKDILINKDPDFINIDENHYALDSNSQAVNQGNVIDGTTISTDILGNIRFFGNLPDLGAYERQH